jgi:hypothetical protein
VYNPYYLLIGSQQLLCVIQLVTIGDDDEDTAAMTKKVGHGRTDGRRKEIRN